ncbi:MAG TPA: hypothetical protein DCS93_28385 [Microscillaceae bacterium]|nr:hypothetical protein [Microscillaceae bacterium]
MRNFFRKRSKKQKTEPDPASKSKPALTPKSTPKQKPLPKPRFLDEPIPIQKRKPVTTPDFPVLKVYDKGGVVLHAGNGQYVWVLMPFWEVSDSAEIALPKEEIMAIIVLNKVVEGRLPLSSFLAVNQSLESVPIYVLNPDNPFDWYSPQKISPKEITDLIQKPQPLSAKRKIGELTIKHKPETNFIQIDIKHHKPAGPNPYSIVQIGVNIPMAEYAIDNKKCYSDYCIGGLHFGEETSSKVLKLFEERGYENLPNFMFLNYMVQANPLSVPASLNHLGIDTHLIGVSEFENEQ